MPATLLQMVVALRQARAIKCEELRQEALRQIRRRKRDVPDMPAAMWKNAKTGTGTFAHEIRLAAQEENPLLDASVLDNAIQTFLSRICPTFVELSISQLRMVPFKTFLLTSFSSLNHSSLWPWMHRERVSCSDCYLTFSPLAGMSSAGLRAAPRRCFYSMSNRGHR